MADRPSPPETADAGSSSPVVVYPPPGPFSAERPPSPARSLRQRSGKNKADEDTPAPSPSSAPTPTTTPIPVSAPRNRKKWGGLVFELENRGSVARDHLASERTFLAWLRTSLGLASIGIAITQLFRLPSTTTTSTPAAPTPTASSLPAASSLSSALAALETANPSLASLVAPLFEAQQAQIVAAEGQLHDSTKYRHLGKPIGGTFIVLALVFLLLGVHRYFAVQTALMREPSQFPPSRRSVGFGAFCVAALVLASFVAILTTR